MGLDCSHNAFSGSYHSFDRLRKFICEDVMGGIWPDEHGGIWYYGNNDKKTNPGLTFFLNHSDCDGKIPPKICSLIADELEGLMPTIKENDYPCNGHGHITAMGGYTAAIEKFIAGCRSAASKNEPLLFE